MITYTYELWGSTSVSLADVGASQDHHAWLCSTPWRIRVAVNEVYFIFLDVSICIFDVTGGRIVQTDRESVCWWLGRGYNVGHADVHCMSSID